MIHPPILRDLESLDHHLRERFCSMFFFPWISEWLTISGNPSRYSHIHPDAISQAFESKDGVSLMTMLAALQMP